ncbi:MAG: cytochrome c-type biosis protein CcmH [Francisellaceae bacterium]|nr:cytochrome c-type biosis protein CcmH [Francisellaceae bacterium]
MNIQAEQNNSQELYYFSNPNDKADFNEIIHSLRCLVCQNQSLTESEASFAKDLKNEIYQRIKNGEHKQDLFKSLTIRYGEFIFYDPPVNYLTVGLWSLPFVILILIFISFFKRIKWN